MGLAPALALLLVMFVSTQSAADTAAPAVAEQPQHVKLEDSRAAPHMQATLLSESAQLVPGP